MKRQRRGSVLAEFAIISLILFVLLAGMLSLGLGVARATLAQNVANLAAREFSRLPLAEPLGLQIENYQPNTDLEEAGLYSDQCLMYVNIAETEDWPLINRMLLPAMVYDEQLGRYRFPGALVERNGANGPYPTVLVPIVDASNLVTWVLPVEEVGDANDDIFAIRVNIPVQSSMMTAHHQQTNQSDPNVFDPVLADDEALSGDPPAGFSLLVESNAGFADTEVNRVHAGRYGLGRHFAQGKLVRPFRQVVSGMAAYRREAYVE